MESLLQQASPYQAVNSFTVHSRSGLALVHRAPSRPLDRSERRLAQRIIAYLNLSNGGNRLARADNSIRRPLADFRVPFQPRYGTLLAMMVFLAADICLGILID